MAKSIFKSSLEFFKHPGIFIKNLIHPNEPLPIVSYSSSHLKKSLGDLARLKNERIDYSDQKAVRETEKWVLKKIHDIGSENIELRQKSSTNKNRLIITPAICRNQAERDIVKESFLYLYGLYKKINKNIDALRMLEIATLFGSLPEKEFNWAMTTVLTEKIMEGFWLGEASLHYTSNGRSDLCRQVIEMSANKGNELSRFILNINKGPDRSNKITIQL